MKKRALGYAVAGTILLVVSAVSAYLSHFRRAEPGAHANLEFTLKDMHGADVRLADFKGRPLIVNFWATWCPPCILEQPELTALSEHYKDRGLAIVGISFDDEPADIRKYADEFKVPYPLLVGKDRDDVFDAFGLRDGLPTSVFIRADGTIAARLQGINTRDWFEARIDEMITP